MKLPDWLISSLNDGSTPPVVSQTRLAVFLVVLCTIVGPCVVIGELSLIGGKPVPIPDGWVPFMGSAVTAVCALFAINKRTE